MQSHLAIKAKFNQQTINKIIATRNKAIDYIENTVNNLNIACGFSRRPLYIFTKESKNNQLLEKEVNILNQTNLDIKAANFFPLNFRVEKAFKLENQARFNPYLYIISIAEYLRANGCELYENTPIIKIEDKQDGCIAYTNHTMIKAKKLIMATHIPKGFNLTQMIAFPYRSYVVGLHFDNFKYPLAHCWDLDQSVSISTHNVFTKDADVMLIAGSHHKVGQPKYASYNEHYRVLEQYAMQYLAIPAFDYRWSAQHYISADLLPYIGLANRLSKNLYMATGYATDGLVYGTVAGLLLADLLQNIPNPAKKLFNSNRCKPLATASKVIKENMNVTCQYLIDYLSCPKKTPFDKIQANEATIIKANGKKCAAYRDENNQLHVVSAVCTHMKCIVHWNAAEKSWDCPCHGSRFGIDGHVIEGPALIPLKKMEE
jgi:Rieske Fe-S protein